jgi:hypothetical protein
MVGRSWILPEAKSAGELLYVTDFSSNEVSVLELPKGKLVGTLSGFDGPSGECTDAKGDVFIANLYAAQIVEYSHGGGSPKAILTELGYYPVACSVDPLTGDLAVTNANGPSGAGNVAIYAKASGKPEFYTDPDITQFGYCAYDEAGNLYAGGQRFGSQDEFAELPSGQSEFTALTLNLNISGVQSAMQWSGKELAISADGSSLVYFFKIKNYVGKVAAVLRLNGASGVSDFTIQGAALYAPLVEKSEVAAYAYPNGGKAIKKLLGFDQPNAAAVSIRSQ